MLILRMLYDTYTYVTHILFAAVDMHLGGTLKSNRTDEIVYVKATKVSCLR